MKTVPRSFAIVLIAAVALTAAGCGRKRSPEVEIAPARVNTIGVNSWLWRAALDTLSFMPIAQTDSNGGVIVTDWYVNPKAPNERIKVSVFVLDQDLRADAVKVSAQRQVNQSGVWVDNPVRAGTVQRLEEVILGKARDLRRAAVVR